MTHEFCEMKTDELQVDIENLERLIDLYGETEERKEILSEKIDEFTRLLFIGDLKELKSLIQRLEYLHIQEYKTSPSHSKDISALISIINVTHPKKSYRTAFSISKRIRKSNNEEKRKLLSEIRKKVKELRPIPAGANRQGDDDEFAD